MGRPKKNFNLAWKMVVDCRLDYDLHSQEKRNRSGLSHVMFIFCILLAIVGHGFSLQFHHRPTNRIGELEARHFCLHSQKFAQSQGLGWACHWLSHFMGARSLAMTSRQMKAPSALFAWMTFKWELRMQGGKRVKSAVLDNWIDDVSSGWNQWLIGW